MPNSNDPIVRQLIRQVPRKAETPPLVSGGVYARDELGELTG
jgi:hypothetical protein